MNLKIDFCTYDDGLFDFETRFYKVSNINQFYKYLIKIYVNKIKEDPNGETIHYPGHEEPPNFEEFIIQCIHYYLQKHSAPINKLDLKLVRIIFSKSKNYYSDSYEWTMKEIDHLPYRDITKLNT